MRLFRRLLTWLLFLSLLAGGGTAWIALRPLGLSASPLDFQVQPGSSTRSAARQMADAGIDLNPWVFEALARLTRSTAALKAGSYEVEQGITLWDLLQKLTRGDVSQSEMALIEGWNFRLLREKLNAHPDLRHDSQGLTDRDILQRIGAAEAHPEGLFFPDTYLFSKQSSDLDLLARAYRSMKKRLNAEWESRDPNLPLQHPYQALILASIVEKETGKAADRPYIAAVFVNRLRQGMLLQTDPTVIYGIGARFDGNLRKNDLLTDTPYNTYTRPGLPPTPIAMPGQAALQAALHPARSQALYFVARGDGSSHFSTSLDEHNQAVNKYQRGGR
jgi:UPF0755 protein